MPKNSYELYVSTISDDPVATVLRFHLLTEFQLEQLIRVILKRGDRIADSDGFTYAQKLCIVTATDHMSDGLASALKNLNKLRNRCSHELNHQISASDLERIGSPLGKLWSKIKLEHEESKTRIAWLFGNIAAALDAELERAAEEFHGEAKLAARPTAGADSTHRAAADKDVA